MARNIVKTPASLKLRNLGGIYSNAPQMDELFRLIPRVARSDRTVLVTGETGTGKELVAQAIHQFSRRHERPFRVINCAALSPTLLESELFGHVKGAFTGAIHDKKGSFALAHKGTIFLDEVAEIPIDIQGRLLRVLQEETFVPVGSTRTVRVDVRLVSATNKALSDEVAAGRFRADLSYRVKVIPFHLPPLRERAGDPERLMWHFIEQLNTEGMRKVDAVTRRALEAVRTYHWPGNVRELVSVMEHAFVVGEGPVIDLEDFPPELRGEREPAAEAAVEMHADSAERRRLLAVLNSNNWNREASAAALGVSRSTLWRRMSRCGLVRNAKA